MSKELGKRITELLNRKGMTQKELAETIGVTEAVMSRYLSGDRDPKPETVANIATALHTTSDYLLGIEREDSFDPNKITRLIARNVPNMTTKEKMALIAAILGEK